MHTRMTQRESSGKSPFWANCSREFHSLDRRNCEYDSCSQIYRVINDDSLRPMRYFNKVNDGQSTHLQLGESVLSGFLVAYEIRLKTIVWAVG